MNIIKVTSVGISFIIVWSIFPLLLSANEPIPIDECNVSQYINGECQNSQGTLSEVETNEVEQINEDVFPKQNTFRIFIQTIAALAFVIFLLYMFLRFVGKRSQSFRSTQMLQNIGGAQLGTNRSIQIIRVNDRIFVVGVGESIHLLKEITDPEEVTKMIEQHQQKIESFDQPLDKVKSWFKKENRNEPQTSHDAFKQILTKQLKDVQQTQKKVHDEVEGRDNK
ncbi:flagellar biosynthetic protein FliO [Bacillus sp. JCM 19034]|uniref:flagellar biosynthetic protein FliO n=1 Tax=Bacillus sp. JCM 19034 TaxID=1481928 RepID=UPI000785F2FA|nr:flagellar biosynthetic protein FliO [Bacillus sp. JCM 19034]